MNRKLQLKTAEEYLADAHATPLRFAVELTYFAELGSYSGYIREVESRQSRHVELPAGLVGAAIDAVLPCMCARAPEIIARDLEDRDIAERTSALEERA